MTRLFSVSAMLIGGLAALGGSAYGAQPPDVVQSDAFANTAMGASALYSLGSGQGNTAAGLNALYANTNGWLNTALGLRALSGNSTGSYNTATGAESLGYNSSGFANDAQGYFSLGVNTTGYFNAAFGYSALYSNTTGTYNTSFGAESLYSNTTGTGNIAVGYFAGQYLTTGSNNIDIGNMGVAGESATIRIGASGSHTATYIAGIARTPLEGSQVVISKNGQLGVLASSERYKTAIASMGPDSSRLSRLRPVTFHLKTNPRGTLQYGLIAEEVDKVYPDLVIRDEAGRIQGVRYDELAPMLLNEMQLEQKQLAAQSNAIAAQGRALGDMQRQFAELKAANQAMQAALAKIQPKEERVAKL